MRGEDQAVVSVISIRGGSPPHARGRRIACLERLMRVRITPACAGKTAAIAWAEAEKGDHPRMRGEDYSEEQLRTFLTGSPPHARGRPVFCRLSASPIGITPACAGKTDLAARDAPPTLDHPRMRGEDSYALRTALSQVGSPPHARGRRARRHAVRRLVGDHPRMRGEDVMTSGWRSRRQGSPPHARGRQRNRNDRCHAGGITPACAGKTSRRLSGRISRTDHPRMRGEDATMPPAFNSIAGSPPHARGRPVPHMVLAYVRGITPACAGKTSWAAGETVIVKDHPRMRGEDPSTTAIQENNTRSPPHARGRPDPQGPFTFFVGITPACAGKTINPMSLGW